MIEYCLILPEKPSPFLNKMIDNTLEGIPYIIVEPMVNCQI